MLFQDTLKELRKKKGISQYDLADALNISRSVIAKWETGLTLPNEDNINILCEYFDVTKEELMGNFEDQEIITNKNKKLSLFKKIIFILSSLLLITIITIIVLASIGFRGENRKEPPITSDTTYILHTNDNNIYPFKPQKIKPSDGVEQEKEGYVLTEIPLNREQSVTLFKEDEIFNDVEIRWTCNNSDKGTNDSLGSYHLWQEGLYNFTLFENYYEEKLIYIEIKLEKVDTIYQTMNLYFIDNSKTSISMEQITPETDTNFSSLMWCWYAKDCMLEEGDKIYFSTRLSVTNELYVLNGFNESNMFEEIYDDEFNGYYLLVKETHIFSTILLEYDGSKINLYYEYDSE